MKLFFTKIISLVLGIVCIFAVFTVNFSAKAAELTNDEFDMVFLETIEEILPENYTGDIELVANKETLFDIKLNHLGYIYNFTVNGETGFATIINTSGAAEIVEIYFNAVNPFSDVGLLNYNQIFITDSFYIYYSNGNYFSLSGNIISEEGLAFLIENAYCYNGPVTTSTETIYYSTRTVTDSLEMAKRHPSIINALNLSNGCVPVAAANIVQFWDRYCTDLIANYTPGVVKGSYYLYNVPSTTLNNLTSTLYTYMGTDTLNPGTTINQFFSGLSSYCATQGYSVSYESCMNGYSFSYALAKQKMTAGKPLILFLSGFTAATIDENTGYDIITYISTTGTHAMAGFGYKDITYSLLGGGSRTDNYIAVASGFGECSRGYFNINYNTQIDDVYSVYIN